MIMVYIVTMFMMVAEPLAQAIYRQGKMGNDFNSSECKEEVAPSPSDITEEQAANCLKIAGFYHRTKMMTAALTQEYT